MNGPAATMKKIFFKSLDIKLGQFCVSQDARINSEQAIVRTIKWEKGNEKILYFLHGQFETKTFQNHIKRRSRYLFLLFCRQGDVLDLYICDTNGKDDVYINDKLVEEGYAEFKQGIMNNY